MSSIKQLRKLFINGSLLSLSLTLLLVVMSLVGLNVQQTATRQIRAQIQIRERLHDLSRSVGQLDLLHLRYQTTGMALFRLGCDQISDSLNTQLKDVQTLVKNDPALTAQMKSITAGIDTIQRYWQSFDDHAPARNVAQTALEEEKLFDVIRLAATDFDELSRLRLKNLQQRQDGVMVQMRSWLIPLEILIAVILLALCLRSWLTRINNI